VGVGWVATGVAPSPDRDDEWAGGSAADDFFSLWRGDGETRKQSWTPDPSLVRRGTGWPPARNGRRAGADRCGGRPATYVRGWGMGRDGDGVRFFSVSGVLSARSCTKPNRLSLE
jgi:hypothetical protein